MTTKEHLKKVIAIHGAQETRFNKESSSQSSFHKVAIMILDCQVLRDLKEDFNLTARESIALMATHAIAPQVGLFVLNHCHFDLNFFCADYDCMQ